ncbi:retrovirus-related pol polyprotein from transposon TNT 1-94 [Tanacetum coccineum]
MHNNIMAAGSKDRPPMLGPGRYSQWRSRFLRYLDTKSNGEYLRKCIFEGPYTPTNVLIAAVEAAENILPVAAHEEAETIHNMTTENKLYFQAEKEAIFLILTGIGDEIYSTVDACNTAKEMWTAIERLQQGESLNVQDVKTNLFWEFGKFTSRDGESMESYYSRFYKLMNELTRNNLQVSPMQVNVQFLQQLQPECSEGTRKCKKEFGILAKYFKKALQTYQQQPSNSLTPEQGLKIPHQVNNDNQSRQFGNQRTMTIAGAREIVDSQVVQQTGIQCFNCKGYGHYAKECRKPKRLNWLETRMNEIENRIGIHIPATCKDSGWVHLEESSSTGQPLDRYKILMKDDSNVTPDSSNICTNDNQADQNPVECVDERDALANLIADLTLDMGENKTILKQLKKSNASLTQELKKCKTNLDETNSALGEAYCVGCCMIALLNKQNEFEKYKAFMTGRLIIE